jgi:hypothetical protein
VETERRERGRYRRREGGKETEEINNGEETLGKRNKGRDKRLRYSGGKRRREKRLYTEERQWRATERRNREERWRSTEGRDKGSDRGKRQRE